MDAARAPGGRGPLAAIGIAAALVALCAAAAAGHELRRLQAASLAKLSAAAHAKAALVASWRAERLSDARSIAAHPLVARAALRLQQGNAIERQRSDLVAWARSRMERREYAGAVVVGLDGKPIASVGPAPADGALHAGEVLRARPAAPVLMDLHEDASGGLHADVVAPLFVQEAASRTLVGAVLLRIDPSVHLFPLLESSEATSPHDRTTLVRGAAPAAPPALRWLDASAPLTAVSPVPGSGWSCAVTGDARAIRAAFADALRWIAVLATVLLGASFAVALIWRGHQVAAHERLRREAEQERSARSRIERALRESEDKFRAAFFEARVGTALVDRTGRFLEFNDALAAMLGYEAEELRARNFRELLHPDDAEGSARAFAKLLSGERDHNDMERRYVRKDGRAIHARYSVSAIRDAAGAFVAAVAVIEDVSEHVRALEELRAGEERLRLALEATNDGVFDWNVARDELYLSERFRRMLAAELPRPARGRDVAALFHPAGRAEVEAILAEVVVGRRSTFELEHRLRCGPGWTWVLVRGKVVASDANGTAVRVVGACTDATERRDLRAQLVIADRMASIGTLAAGVAHEINNPLAYVVANLGFVREAVAELSHPPADPAGVLGSLGQALDDARDGAERVRRIVLDLKALSRSDETTLPVDVRGALDAALAVAGHEIARRATLVRRLAPVPCVVANAGRLGQVFLNLLVNAAQAIPEGNPAGHEIRVATSTDARGRVVVEIADTGSGIPPEILERMFDPFFTTKPAGVGTGLGLAISRGIVAALGGEIQVESEVGAGSTFRVLLPPPAS